MRAIGLNYSSRFIPIIIECTKEKVGGWPKGEMDMNHFCNNLTYSVQCRILFGDDVDSKVAKCEYTDNKGVAHMHTPQRALELLGEDATMELKQPYTLLMPFMADYDLGPQNQRFLRNQRNCFQTFRDFLKHSSDKDSVWCKVLKDAKGSEEELFWDIIAILVGGHDSSSKMLVTGLYEMKRNPDIAARLKAEIDEIKDINTITPEALDQMPYLGWFVKECLRFSTPSLRSLGYKAWKKTEVDGIEIPKGQVVVFNIAGVQWNKN